MLDYVVKTEDGYVCYVSPESSECDSNNGIPYPESDEEL